MNERINDALELGAGDGTSDGALLGIAFDKDDGTSDGALLNILLGVDDER